LSHTVRELYAEIKLEDEIYRGADDPTKGRRRADNVEEVVNSMASFEERDDDPSLAGFLDKVSLLDKDQPNRDSKEKKLQQDAVILMSLHSSKGLEFPVVFMVGMEEEYLPHKRAMNETFDIEEERRLCYVGITRARSHLLLLNAASRKKYGKLQPRIASRFLQEIPGDLLQEQTSEGRPPASEEEQEVMASSFFTNMRAMLGD
jgi:DNA helicase-2/ATP-dependent DNA helicase PcrA